LKKLCGVVSKNSSSEARLNDTFLQPAATISLLSASTWSNPLPLLCARVKCTVFKSRCRCPDRHMTPSSGAAGGRPFQSSTRHRPRLSGHAGPGPFEIAREPSYSRTSLKGCSQMSRWPPRSLPTRRAPWCCRCQRRILPYASSGDRCVFNSDTVRSPAWPIAPRAT